jgi:sortase (surface protein transpeptidase)
MLHRLFQAIANRNGRQSLISFLVLAAVVGGVVAIVIATRSQESAPTPPASAAGRLHVNTESPTTPAGQHTNGSHHQTSSPPSQQPAGEQPLPASVPTTIDIPAIKVHSEVISIGQDADGTLAVPQPGPDLNKAAWYDGSVTPGQDGPSVIEGHIDSVYGPSVFFQLGAIRPGNTIGITRADNSRMTFTVNAVRAYASHAAFPTEEVYGADLGHPTLRLITCSNFDESTGHYVGNTVVFAHLTAIHHAPSGQ